VINAAGEITWGETKPAGTATPEWKMVGGSAGYSEPGKIFAYFGGSFGDLSIDFGLGFGMAEKKRR